MTRCFVAIELPAEVKGELARVESEFKKVRMDFLRWVRPDAIHLTLKFLGEVPDARVPELVRAMGSAVKWAAPFALELGGPGVFPGLRQPRVFWVGVEGDVDRLKALQSSVDTAFGGLGFEKEDREFAAHLTLARVQDAASSQQRQALGEMVSRSRIQARCRFVVSEISLIKSELKPTGAVYTRLTAVPIVG